MQTCSFSSIECLLEYTSHNIIDILLIGEDVTLELDSLTDKAKHIYILTEEQDKERNYSHPCIYKFQSAEQILLDILELYMQTNIEKNGLIKATANSKKILCIFSPKGGSKKTLFSLALSNYYGSSHKTLYANLELFSELSFLSSNGSPGFSELLYYIKQKSPNLIMKLNSIVKHYNNFEFIPPVDYYQDLLEMNEEDINFFLQCLLDYSDYEVIIFEAQLFGKAILEMLNFCNKIYITFDNDFISKDNRNAFYKQLEERNEKEILRKIEEIILSGDDLNLTEDYIDIDNFSDGKLYNFITDQLEMEV